MATYVNDLRLKEIATGESAGTWGTETNVNLELIAEAMGHGSEAIANASTHTITMQDGVSDEFRSTFLRLTGGGQACTVTLAPNTLSHTWIMRNETNSTLTLTQGSGANVAISAGQTKIVTTDGAGSGAVVYEMDDLELAGNLAVGGNATVTGNIDVDGTTNLDVVDIDGAVDMASTLTVAGAVTGSSSFATAAGGTFTTASGNDLNLVYPDARSLFFKEGSTTTLTLDNAQGATFAGAVTANAGVVVDNITIDGTTIALSSGDLTLDAASYLILDADGGNIVLQDNADTFGRFVSTNDDFTIQSDSPDKDIIFKGNDGGSFITALTLDMSAAGAATFNSTVTANAGVVVDNTTFDANKLATSSGNFFIDSAADIYLDADGANIFLRDDGTNFGNFNKNGNNLKISSSIQDGDILFAGDDGGSAITALTLDMSAAGAATFNAGATFGGNVTVANIYGGSGGSGVATLQSTSGNSNHSKITVGDIVSSDNGGITFFTAGSSVATQALRLAGTSQAATFAGAITANAGVVVDNFTLDGTTLSLSSGNMTLDVAGNIILDSDAGQVVLADGGSNKGLLKLNGDNLEIKTEISNADMKFNGNDGGSAITALTLDMSAAGAATFNAGITTGGSIIAGANIFRGNMQIESNEIDVSSGDLTIDVAGDINLDAGGADVTFRKNGTEFGRVFGSSDNFYIQARQSDKDMIFQGIDGGSAISALTLDMSAAGAATFNAGATFGGNVTTPTSGSVYAQYFGNSSDTNTLIQFAGSDDIRFRTGGTERFRISSDGSLSTPTAGTSNVRFGVNAGNSITSGGNYNTVVGDEAGTAITTGDANVAVGYQALATEDANGLNTAVGYQALKTLNAGADGYNTAVGYIAGVFLTTGKLNTLIGSLAGDALTTGFQNIAIGYDALGAETLGGDNVAIGTQALATQNTPSGSTYNVGIGTSAGRFITTGTHNTLLGGLSGDALTTGDSNIAVGSQALSSDTKGSKSVAIGRDALLLQNFTSATNAYNVAVGDNAGAAVTTGVDNTLIGGLAGDAITDADYNVALGNSSLSANTVGSKNTAIGSSALLVMNPDSAADTLNTAVGYHAGRLVSTGVQNTLMGGLAGDGLTTADGNTALGYNSLGSTCTGDYNQAFGVGALNANTSGAGNIGIGLNALFSNTGSSLNVAIGTGALDALNIGSGNGYNVAIGDQAGGAVTTGIQNTLIGGLAGDALTDADQNVAIGYAALTADTLGSKSIAIGREALVTQNFSSATDVYNVAVGHNAGQLITTSTNNTLIGGLAGDALTSGSLNTAVGYSALSGDTLGVYNVAVGVNALLSQNFTSSTFSYNTAVGTDAGKSVTTGTLNTLIGGLAGDALTTGQQNVALGYTALSADDVGNHSVAIGTGALLSQNYGSATNSYNTAVGSTAGAAVTTGIENTLIGGNAGDALQDADSNVAIGVYALTSDTLGSRAVAIGRGALSTQNFTSATENYNVAIGYQTGGAVTTGTNNTFVGALAGDGTDDGGSNVAVGSSALSANCGSSNTAVGVSALTSSTGATNTAFGFQAGANATSANNNVFLGRDSGITGSPGGNVTTAGGILCVGDENIGAAHVQVDWTVASDARDKTDFTALDLGLDFVKALAPVTYKWDKRSKYGDKSADGYDLNAQTPDGTHKEDWLDIGFKAQEVEALEIAAGYNKDNNTNLVSSHTEDGKQMGLQYSKFVPILVKAIQEQQTLIESLTARIETLEG
tara:strand:+ start:16121 stop:21310 length:5190 start_codon:yes stop_codon:yes gene_type:complete